MPYSKREDLPGPVTHVLPVHAQDIYKEAFNSAWEEYKDPSNRKDGGDREETAHRVAWAAVKKKYQKGSDNSWHPKS